ncbi:hypothetical protein INE81_04421 [Bacteroides salyersiae]|nr:hypothetical protein INE81_04421 [Bacteroides salyersiae]
MCVRAFYTGLFLFGGIPVFNITKLFLFKYYFLFIKIINFLNVRIHVLARREFIFFIFVTISRHFHFLCLCSLLYLMDISFVLR